MYVGAVKFYTISLSKKKRKEKEKKCGERKNKNRGTSYTSWHSRNFVKPLFLAIPMKQGLLASCHKKEVERPRVSSSGLYHLTHSKPSIGIVRFFFREKRNCLEIYFGF